MTLSTRRLAALLALLGGIVVVVCIGFRFGWLEAGIAVGVLLIAAGASSL